MNRSWINNSQNSPGFVYFNNTNTPQNPDSSSDFIPLGDSPQQPCFNPENYSSPRQFRGTPYNTNRRNWKQNRYSTGKYENRSFNSPNSSYNSSFNSTNSYKDNSLSKHQVSTKTIMYFKLYRTVIYLLPELYGRSIFASVVYGKSVGET